MQLFHREYGERSVSAHTVVLLHGLFGSSGNWHGVARNLADRFHVVSVDLRNHGRSPHADVMDYPSMGEDVLALLEALGLARVDLVGHSMGGKAAMWLALQQPGRVGRLVSVDIAPVDYDHAFDGILDAMESVRLDSVVNRADADRALSQSLDNPLLRGYLLQNLAKQSEVWQWKINIPALRRGMEDITGFPDIAPGRQFLGDTLFIYGGRSDYVRPEHAATAKSWFPYLRLRMIPEAGHWVYSEAPAPFISALTSFLE